MATKSRTKAVRKEEGKAEDISFPLAEEVRTYESHLPEWVDREGQFVLIKRSEVLGFYPRYEQALEAGYDRLGNEDFLVKQMTQYERIYNLGHVAF